MKDFKKWNEKKEKIHANERKFFFYEREVWWGSLGANVGDEQDGAGNEFIRPIVIVKKFSRHVFWGVPLTTKEKKGKYYFSFLLSNRRNTAILSQLRLLDSKRLIDRMGMVPEKDFTEIKKAISGFTN